MKIPKIKKFKLSELKVAEYNPRVIDDGALEGLAHSIERFGCVEPIVVNVKGGANTIIGGHQRLRALEGLGVKDVICMTVSCSKADEKLLNLSLNNPAIQGKFIEDISGYIDAIRAELPDDTDYLALRINELRGEIEETKAGLTDDDQVPEPPKKPKSKRGDLYILGNHRLLCGDATIKADVARLMGKKKADMVFTDPPYELDTKGGGVLKNSKVMAEIRSRGMDTFNPLSLELHAKTNIFCCNKTLIPKYIELAAKFQKAWDIAIYHKKNVAPNFQGHLMTDCEYQIIIGEIEPETDYLLIVGLQKPNIGYKKELYSKVFYGSKDKNVKEGYSKPVALCEKFIRLFSNRDQIVSDTFLGSGSTMIAAEKLNRRCYGMEIDPIYCDVAVKRWEQWTGKKAKKKK